MRAPPALEEYLAQCPPGEIRSAGSAVVVPADSGHRAIHASNEHPVRAHRGANDSQPYGLIVERWSELLAERFPVERTNAGALGLVESDGDIACFHN